MAVTGLIYGRRTYEIMRYWDEGLPDWDAEDREFAVAWRNQPKWVVSHSLKSAGPNATLIADDFEEAIRRLKSWSWLARFTLADQSWRKA